MVDQKKHRASPPIASTSRIISSRTNWTQHLCFVESSDAPAPGQSEMLVSDTLAPVTTVFQYQLERFPILDLVDIIRSLKRVWGSPNQSNNGSDYSKSDTLEI